MPADLTTVERPEYSTHDTQRDAIENARVREADLVGQLTACRVECASVAQRAEALGRELARLDEMAKALGRVPDPVVAFDEPDDDLIELDPETITTLIGDVVREQLRTLMGRVD